MASDTDKWTVTREKKEEETNSSFTTLLRHSGVYLLSKGLPGIISFVAIIAYTRLLTPEAYGQYALVIAGVSLFNSVFYQWLRLSLLRFLPSFSHKPKELLSAVCAGFALVAALTGSGGLLAASLWPDPEWQGLIAIGVPLLWAQAWFAINIELARSQLAPGRYGLLSGIKAVTALALGVLLVLWGLGAYGALLGLIGGFGVAGVGASWTQWKGILFNKKTLVHLRRMSIYGFPLALNFALTFIVSKSDRILIALLMDESAAGIYSAGYDLGWQSLGMLLSIVNLAAYPLAVRALETEGWQEAQVQLKENLSLLLAVAVPASLGLALLAPSVARVILGAEFEEAGIMLLPWVALGNFLFGLKVYYADLSFQLSKNTTGQVTIALTTALLNLGLNIWWIPTLGIVGAIYSTVLSYALALAMSWVLGQRLFALPRLGLTEGKVAAAGLLMAAILLVLKGHVPVGAGYLALLIVAGAAFYGFFLLLFNPMSLRSRVLGFVGLSSHRS